MSSGLSPDIAECYRRAAEFQQLAQLSSNDHERDFYLKREQDWLVLTREHQLQEGIELPIDGLDRRGGVTITRPCPACRTVTPVHYSTLFVCTNCKLVFEAK